MIKILPEYRLHENFLQTGPMVALAVMRQREGVVLSCGFGWPRYPSKYGVTSAWPPSATSLLFVNTASNNAMLMGRSRSDPEQSIIGQSLDDVNKLHAYQKCVCVRKLTPPLQCGSIPLNPLRTMSRIRAVELKLLTRKSTFANAMMTNGHKMASCDVMDEMNRHGVTGEEWTKAFPMDVAVVQEAGNAARTDELMRVLQ